MKFNLSKNSSSKSKHPDRQYQNYVFIFLILCATCLFLKTVLDINILLSTGRMVSTQDWVDLILSRKEKMAVNSPLDPQRILIVSASNSLFSLSAKTISQKTGLRTINLGSYGGLGGAYILNRAAKLIRKGDIILLPLEYEFYSSSDISDDFKKDSSLARFMISYDRNSLKEISTTSILNFVFSNAFSGNGKKEYMSYFRGQLAKKDILERLQQQHLKGGCYSGYSLNEYGDETCNMGDADAPVNPEVIKDATPRMPRSMSKIDPGGYIQRFVQLATNKGAKIIPLYPVSTYTDDYQDLAFKKSAQKIKKYWEDLGIEFQDSLMDSLLPPNLMLNGNYHANDIGREKRTKIIINTIENYLKKSKQERA
jgi:hypothetical protein